MQLTIAGGCLEHGRNCFLIGDKNISILIDCGIIPDKNKVYPKLSDKQIKKVNYLFITHIHQDHAGALEWLINKGFAGTIISSQKVREQLKIEYQDWLCLPMNKNMPITLHLGTNMEITYGRSGHCAGSLWFHLSYHKKKILFSGDYSEQTLFYQCDKINNLTADLAILDCAYTSEVASNITKIKKQIETAIASKQILLLPIPRYGRGLELLALIQQIDEETMIYVDEKIKDQITKYSSIWTKTTISLKLLDLKKWHRNPAVILVADPQLKHGKNHELANIILNNNGKILFTGHIYNTMYANDLLKNKNVKKISYPIHLDFKTLQSLVKRNSFKKVIINHNETAFDTKDNKIFSNYKTGDTIEF